VNVWPDDVHTPLVPPVDQWGDGSKRGLYLAVLESMDRQLGKLFDHIRNTPKLRDNTLIVVCSDNGPEPGAGSAGELRGHKACLYEGGIRSPLVVWAPKWISPSCFGEWNRESVLAAFDLAPSLLEIAGVEPAADAAFDGESHAETLLGKSNASRHAPVFFRRPPDRDQIGAIADAPDLAMRASQWKLLCEYDGSEPQLYDVLRDPGETHNLAGERPEVVAELTPQLLAWHAEMPADRGATFGIQKPPKRQARR
jgi:uncharacterized sulfatase